MDIGFPERKGFRIREELLIELYPEK